MLRVGLTGELGSGKSTVARMLAAHGAVVLSSDEMARAMMEPGEPVFAKIVEQFGSSIVRADGTLDRGALGRLAFNPESPRVEELNAIIHPAVIAEQARLISDLARTRPDAIVVVESALIFSTRHAPEGGWRTRFDCIVVLNASEEQKIARFVDRVRASRELTLDERVTLETDARTRLAEQRSAPPVEPSATLFVLSNDGSVNDLQMQVDTLWQRLQALRSARAV